ncbi:MAG: hypothetical protein KUG64_11190 [Cycloclasticus sp.]|nr:hypothetical protein [Cycloclasticus sp.]
MKANINELPLTIKRLPKRYKRVNGMTIDGYDSRTDLHLKDGFRDVIRPDYNKDTHYLGKLIIVDDSITYEVLEHIIVDSSEEEIKQQLIKDGVTINNFHFATITDVNNFVTQKNELEKLGLTEMGWNDKDNKWVTMTIEQSQSIFLQASMEFQNIYKD